MLILLPSSRLRAAVAAGCIVLALVWMLDKGVERSSHFPISFVPSYAGSKTAHQTQVDFWGDLQDLLTFHSPECAPPEQTAHPSPDPGFGNGGWTRTELLLMSGGDVARMHDAHTAFVQDMSMKTPMMVYTKGTRGIVTTAGGAYFPGLVVSLRMLRRTGSTLPVEVFVASDEEYEPYMCEALLPALNAECVVLSSFMDAVPQAKPIARFQYKIFSILFSSFEEVLFLDSDDFPVRDPIALFTSEPFLSTGLITWPDFWHSTTSTRYFNISSQPEPSVMLRATSEAGQLIYSKRSHEKSLLLAAYYNYYGPEYYFRLLSQGGQGEGDKETFINAASALNEPFFATAETVHGIGGARVDGSNGGWAMVQYDPIANYMSIHRNDSDVEASKRPFFLHANVPKLNPGNIFDLDNTPTKNAAGQYTRLWDYDEHIMSVFGFDLEREIWEEMKWIGCELEGEFKDWQFRQGICANVTQYWHEVFD